MPEVESTLLSDPEIPAQTAETPRPLSTRQILSYSAANIGCGAFYSFNNYILPLFLQHYTQNAVLLGLMGSSHSVEGAVIQPLIGSKSDRLRTRWGRRRPFFFVFFLLAALAMALTPSASHAPPGIRLPLVVSVIFLFTVLFNIGVDPYQALMPDITPPKQRGRVTGVWAMLGNAAQAAILPLALILRLGFAVQFYIVAVLMVVTTALTCLLVREPRFPLAASQKKSLLAEVREAVRGFRTLKQAAVGMGVIALSGAGIGAVLPYLTLFVKTVTGCGDGQAQMMGFVLMVSTAIFVLPFGWLTDKIGAKRVLTAAFLLIGLASFCALFVASLPQVTVVMVIAGMGNAALSASLYPMLTALVPGEEIGFFTGFQSTMLSLAQPLTVVIVGSLINQGGKNYRLVFLVCAGFMAAALLLLRGVNTDTARGEIAARNRIMGYEA